MRLPTRYIQFKDQFGIRLDESGNILEWRTNLSNISHGFLDADLLEVGNGDRTGFYWAIGKEDGEPILCDIEHDRGQTVPIASTLEELIRLKRMIDDFDPFNEITLLAEKLNVLLPQTLGSYPTAQQQLAVAPLSPVNLMMTAIQASTANEIEHAKKLLNICLNILPEYGLAHFNLAKIYRRNPSQKLQVAQSLLKSVCCPLAFSSLDNRLQALEWLKRFPEFPELKDDPIWSNRNKLTFKYYVKHNDDFAIYEEAISEYIIQGKHFLAIYLRTLVGDLMTIEARAFRERYQYSDEKHRELLIKNLEQAQLSMRIPSIQSL